MPPWTFNDFPCVFIPKAAQNMAATKTLRRASCSAAEGYIRQLHAAPGHVLPVLKTIARDPDYLANPIIEKYPNEVRLMAAAAAGGYNLGFEIREAQAEHQGRRDHRQPTSSPRWCSASC